MDVDIFSYLRWAISTNLILDTSGILEDIFPKNEDLLQDLKKAGLKTDKLFVKKNYALIYRYLYEKTRTLSIKNQFFYRGVSKTDYKLVSGAYRRCGGLREDEDFYFNAIQIEYPKIFKDLSCVEKLTYMQHYNCPTRLLDVTRNPLVALYFACSCNLNEDGVVYLFSFADEEVLLPQSLKIKTLANLAGLTENERHELAIQSYMSYENNKFSQTKNLKYTNNVIEKYFQFLNRTENIYERALNPYDLLSPCVFQPYKDNPRLIKQDGAFIISGLDFDEEDSHQKIMNFVSDRFVIPADKKELILQQLNRLGINESTLFPEIEHASNHLRNISNM